MDVKYPFIERVFEGYSGVVYKACDAESGADIAVKILKQDRISGSREDSSRFSHELDILSGISHPGVLKVFGHGYLNGDFYIILEYIGYPSLDSLYRSQYKFPLNLITNIFIQLVGALSFLHKNKIIDFAVSHIKKITADDEIFQPESLLYLSPGMGMATP